MSPYSALAALSLCHSVYHVDTLSSGHENFLSHRLTFWHVIKTHNFRSRISFCMTSKFLNLLQTAVMREAASKINSRSKWKTLFLYLRMLTIIYLSLLSMLIKTKKISFHTLDFFFSMKNKKQPKLFLPSSYTCSYFHFPLPNSFCVMCLCVLKLKHNSVNYSCNHDLICHEKCLPVFSSWLEN